MRKIKKLSVSKLPGNSERIEMFSNRDLKKMIVPLFLEQLLVLLVGIIDTFMISSAGEAAVSGVSLVNNFSAIFQYLFSALASGGPDRARYGPCVRDCGRAVHGCGGQRSGGVLF